MKKILAIILCFNILSLPAFCAITDNFVEETLDKSLQIKKTEYKTVNDDFADATLNKSIKTERTNYKPIRDDFAENNKNKNNYTAKRTDINEILPKVSENAVTKKKKVVFDTESSIKVPVKISMDYSTHQKIDEGDFIEFKTVEDVKINNKLYPVGTTVKARVENISLNKSMGVPSEVVVGNFSMDGIPLAGEIEKTGANRSFWVQPCTYGLMFFFGIGLLFIPIRGGHAKITTKQIYTLYAN